MMRGTSNFRRVQTVQAALRLICVTTGILLWSSRSLLAQDPALLRCLSWIHDGAYPSGIAQGRCEAKFDLPDPFTITCLAQIEIGAWSDATEQAACHIQLTDLITRQYEDYLDAPTLSSRHDSGAYTSAEPAPGADEDLVAIDKPDRASE